LLPVVGEPGFLGSPVSFWRLRGWLRAGILAQ
jgi:hypothetical protein